MNPLFGNRKIRFLFTYPFIFIALMIIPFLDIGFREYRDYIVNDHIDKFKSHLQTYLSFEPNTQNIPVVRRGNVVIVDVDNRSFHSLFRRGFDILGSKTLWAVVARTPSDVATVVHIRRQYWMLGYYEGGIDIFSRGKDLVSEDNLYNLYQSNINVCQCFASIVKSL